MFNICGAGYSEVSAVTFREHRKSCTAVIFKIFCGLFASSIGPVLNQSILNFGNTTMQIMLLVITTSTFAVVQTNIISLVAEPATVSSEKIL